NNAARVYGTANPTFTARYSGFVNGDTAAAVGVVAGTSPLTTPATASSPLGTYDINVDVNALTAANYTFRAVKGTLTVTAAPLAASGVNFSATAGAPFSGPVATFANADPFGSAASYTAIFTWGDGSTSAGTITGTGTLTVLGSHTYVKPVNQTVRVTISHKLGYTTMATTTGSVTVTTLQQPTQPGQSP